MGAKDDYESLSSLSERLGLDDEQREKFVNSSMQRLGYRPRVDWDEPDESGNGGDDFFSGGQQRRQSRDVGGNGGGRQRRDSGGSPWGY